MADYVGITVGPIFDTLQLAENPASLWYASMCFSELTRLLLDQISQQIPDAAIVAPFYDGTKYTDGVGRYHDRILFKTASTEKLDAVIASAKETLVEMVLGDISPKPEKEAGYREYLHNYFQVHYIIVPQEQRNHSNIFSEINPLLDAIECMPRCNPSKGSNPFKALFSKRGEDEIIKGNRIKASALLNDVVDSQLFHESGSLKSIENICASTKGFKKSSYYAVVCADGDDMSSFFSNMNNDAVRQNSERCFAYTEAVAEEIRKFGGMTIYSGGDDLLFLAPVQSAEGETVFEFCNRISDLFREKVAGGNPFPSASFGIAIRYKTYPLYESLASAFSALFTAKNSRAEKNSIFIDLQKRSGQSVALCVAKEGFPLFNDIMQQNLQRQDEAVGSIIYVLSKFASSIYTDVGDRREKIINIFVNNYDSEAQKKNVNYIRTIAELFCDYLENSSLITAPGHEGITELTCFEWILRIGRFYVERGA